MAGDMYPQGVGAFNGFQGQLQGQLAQGLNLGLQQIQQQPFLTEQANDEARRNLLSQLQRQHTPYLGSSMNFSGNRFVVICNGAAQELAADATLEAAQSLAESLAHKHQTEAFILKPIRRVAPKRDVVTTDL